MKILSRNGKIRIGYKFQAHGGIWKIIKDENEDWLIKLQHDNETEVSFPKYALQDNIISGYYRRV